MGQLISHAQDKTRQNFIDYKEKFADLIVKRKKQTIITEHSSRHLFPR